MEDYMNALRALAHHGQSVWLDFLSRGFLDHKGLAPLVRADAVSGVTSNPSIFKKAIGESEQYDAEIERVTGEVTFAVNAVNERIAVGDSRRAADTLRPSYEAAAARDGFVRSLALPGHGHRWHDCRSASIVRADVMIKVPRTAPASCL